jgi:hypothetical protein
MNEIRLYIVSVLKPVLFFRMKHVWILYWVRQIMENMEDYGLVQFIICLYPVSVIPPRPTMLIYMGDKQ